VKLLRQIGANVVAACSSSTCRSCGSRETARNGRSSTDLDGVRGALSPAVSLRFRCTRGVYGRHCERSEDSMGGG